MISLTSYNDYIKAVGSGDISIIKVYADWCMPCKMMDSIVSEIELEYPNIIFYSLDSENLPEVISELKITALPAFIMNRDNIQTVFTGAVPKIMFRTMVDNLAQ